MHYRKLLTYLFSAGTPLPARLSRARCVRSRKRANCYCLRQFQTKLTKNLGDAVRSHVNGAGDSGNDNRTLPYKSCRDFCPRYHNRALDSVKKGQSSVGIRVAACRRSLPQYAPLGCVTTIHVWQQMIADDIFKTQTFTFVGGGNILNCHSCG